MNRRNNSFKFDFKPIGQAIKRAREAKKMTREIVAEIIDYAPRHIQSVENEGQVPSIELLLQLVMMFDVSLDEYIFKDRKPAKSSMRRRVDTVLDGLEDKDLFVIETTAQGLQKSKELF